MYTFKSSSRWSTKNRVYAAFFSALKEVSILKLNRADWDVSVESKYNAIVSMWESSFAPGTTREEWDLNRTIYHLDWCSSKERDTVQCKLSAIMQRIDLLGR